LIWIKRLASLHSLLRYTRCADRSSFSQSDFHQTTSIPCGSDGRAAEVCCHFRGFQWRGWVDVVEKGKNTPTEIFHCAPVETGNRERNGLTDYFAQQQFGGPSVEIPRAAAKPNRR